jgi:hypothetical protein
MLALKGVLDDSVVEKPVIKRIETCSSKFAL